MRTIKLISALAIIAILLYGFIFSSGTREKIQRKQTLPEEIQSTDDTSTKSDRGKVAPPEEVQQLITVP